MLQNGYNIGGEQSGHIIFLDDNTTGDGLLVRLHLLQVMVETGRKLSDLAAVMEVLPQALVNAEVPNHKKVQIHGVCGDLRCHRKRWRRDLEEKAGC